MYQHLLISPSQRACAFGKVTCELSSAYYKAENQRNTAGTDVGEEEDDKLGEDGSAAVGDTGGAARRAHAQNYVPQDGENHQAQLDVEEE